MKTSSRIIAGLAAVAAAVAVGAVLLQRSPAPEVRFATLAGTTLSTSDLRGKVVLVNFWATSCVTCVKEMPKLAETYRRFAPRGYEMIAVAMSYDHPNQVAEFAKSRELPFKVAIDTTGEIARQFGDVRVTPTSFVIGKDGRILKQFLGEPDWAAFHALLDEALGKPS